MQKFRLETGCNARNVNALWEPRSLLYVNVYCFKRQDFQYVVKERALIFLTKGEGIYGRGVNI